MESETLQVEKNYKNLEARKVMVYSKNSKKQKNGETRNKKERRILSGWFGEGGEG